MSTAPPPVLDRRNDDQILKQLRKLAESHVPKWNPDRRPDAGTMLLRIFTRLMEIALERLNKVPEMNLYAFLGATGINLLPPVPARVPLTFALTSGSAPVLVPQRTRAGTTSESDQQPLDFETTADLTAIPASLVAAWTLDPRWDRYSDHSAFIAGSNKSGGFPLVGSRRLSHTLYLGDEHLLNFNSANVTVTFAGPAGLTLTTPLKVDWQYISNGQQKKVPPEAVGQPELNKIVLNKVDAIDQTFLNGPSETPLLRQGLRSRWLRATVKQPLDEGPGLESPTLQNIQLEVSTDNLLPELAFSNTVPVDVAVPFYPFGQVPKVGDAFYVSCSEALTKAKAVGLIPSLQNNRIVELTLRFEVTETPQKPVLQWEVFGIDGWTKITEVKNPTIELVENPPQPKSATVVIPILDEEPILGEVNGNEGHWIRVRIDQGDYGKPDEYVPINPEALREGYRLVPGDLNPPLVTKLTLSYTASGTPHTIISQNGFLFTDQKAANKSAVGFKPFVDIQELPPVYADRALSFYLGFDRAFPEEPVTLFFAVGPRAFTGASSSSQSGGQIEAAPPSVHWEYFNGASWVGLTVLDQTAQFMQSGTMEFLTPVDIAPFAKFDLTDLYWIRAILASEAPARNLDSSELLKRPILSAIFLNTIPAVQAVTIANEIVGSGNGLPGQTFRLVQSPIVADPEIAVLEPELPSAVEREELLKDEGLDAIEQRINPATGETEIWIRWHEVSSFHGSEPHSRHYTLDHGTGELVFGDGVAGLVPSLGTNNIVANYRVSAGSVGNVPKEAVAQLKSSLPGVASVINPLRADSGADLETAEIVKRRGPQTLRHRERALSRTDFEWLARQAAGTGLARVVCLPNTNRDFGFEPGWVTLIIVPHGTEPRLVPSVELIRHVEESVSSRAFAGLNVLNRINVAGPAYIEVSVEADVVLNDLRQASQVKRQVTDALDKFLHPLMGGPGGEGWELGRNVFASEIASVIHSVPGVDYLRELQLIPSQAQHRIELAFPFVCPFNLPEGTHIVSASAANGGGEPIGDRKSALLAEPVRTGTVVHSLIVKGFMTGDRIIQMLKPDVFNPPLTITSVGVDREKATQLIGIEPSDFELPKEGILSTPDNRIKLPFPRVDAASVSPTLRFLTLEDFNLEDFNSDKRSVQIRLPDGSSPNLPLLKAKKVVQDPDVYLGGIFLVCAGQHRITVSASNLAAA